MQSRLLSALMILLFAVMLFAGGCASKSSESAPGQEPVQVQEGYDYGKTQPQESMQQEGQLQESELSAQQQAAQRQQAMEEGAERIFFDFDSYELSSQARSVLQQKADLMKQMRGMTMVIEGHCDERGTEEYNLALGERRARAAYEFMILLGVSPERMSIVSFGEERPLDPGNNETAWAKNRRDEFRISF